MSLSWEPVRFHPDWRYTDGPGGRYVVRRARKGTKTWIASLNGRILAEDFTSRDAAVRYITTRLEERVNEHSGQ